jgi:hypothetical protein
MKKHIALFLCITHCATAMGQHWLVSFMSFFQRRHQQSGIQIEAKLYKHGELDPLSSDSQFYCPDANNYYVPVHDNDSIEITAFNADNRITLDGSTTVNPKNATIKFNARIGGHQHIEIRSVQVAVGTPKTETFEHTNLYAIISASEATRQRK